VHECWSLAPYTTAGTGERERPGRGPHTHGRAAAGVLRRLRGRAMSTSLSTQTRNPNTRVSERLNSTQLNSTQKDYARLASASMSTHLPTQLQKKEMIPPYHHELTTTPCSRALHVKENFVRRIASWLLGRIRDSIIHRFRRDEPRRHTPTHPHTHTPTHPHTHAPKHPRTLSTCSHLRRSSSSCEYP